MRLLTLDAAGVVKLLDSMEAEVKQIKRNALKIAWFSRGSIQYADVLNLSREEISMMNELIHSNLEVTNTSRIPFF